MKYRLFNKLYANLMGYFWLPCPLCKQMMGGHEWKTHNVNFGYPEDGGGKGVCEDCAAKIRANHPRYSNIMVHPETLEEIVTGKRYTLDDIREIKEYELK